MLLAKRDDEDGMEIMMIMMRVLRCVALLCAAPALPPPYLLHLLILKAFIILLPLCISALN